MQKWVPLVNLLLLKYNLILSQPILCVKSTILYLVKRYFFHEIFVKKVRERIYRFATLKELVLSFKMYLQPI